jgi:hypothetical protein
MCSQKQGGEDMFSILSSSMDQLFRKTTVGALAILLNGVCVWAQVNPTPWPPKEPGPGTGTEVVKMRIGFSLEKCIYARHSPISACSITIPARRLDQQVSLVAPRCESNGQSNCISALKKGHWIDLTEVASENFEGDERYIGIITIIKYPQTSDESGAVRGPSYHLFVEVLGNSGRVAAAETWVADFNNLNPLSLLADEKKTADSSYKISLKIGPSSDLPGGPTSKLSHDLQNEHSEWKILKGEAL